MYCGKSTVLSLGYLIHSTLFAVGPSLTLTIHTFSGGYLPYHVRLMENLTKCKKYNNALMHKKSYVNIPISFLKEI